MKVRDRKKIEEGDVLGLSLYLPPLPLKIRREYY